MFDIVKNIDLLSDIDPQLLHNHIEKNNIYLCNYRKGHTLHSQHEECTTLDIVLSGTLVAYSLAENGSATTMFEFNKDSILGGNLLFGENRKYPLNIYCMSHCTIIHIRDTAVADFLFHYNFVMKFVKSLSQNSQGINRKLAMITQKTLRENILDYLHQLSIQQGSKTVVLPVSKKQLADYFGVQRPSLFRELKRIKDDGLIEIQNSSITIKSQG
jgi:CRP-like cAMP-binding protein